MNSLNFQLPNFKISLEDTLDETKNPQLVPNCMELKQKELEAGLFCTIVEWNSNDTIELKYNSNDKYDFVTLCLWVEEKKNKLNNVETHICNIIDSSTDFSFTLKKNIKYNGFIFCMSKNWIKKNIDSNIMRNYLIQIKKDEVKALLFENNEIVSIINVEKKLKWYFNTQCWGFMSLCFDKIVVNIQNEKRSPKVVSRKNNFDFFKNYIINKSELNTNQVISVLKKQFPFVEKEDYHNISRYVLDVKLSRAVELLEDGQLSIYEVSEKVGFSNNKLNQFSKEFKKRFGITPYNYIKLIKEKSPAFSGYEFS